ncbi:ABC transporter ATP-binding protein [Streptococcus sp.]|uniref:ABC transporter ATP-binding protein n=1 Tax=Streptococcus sp. TaxID=1306 RepID=UPI00025AC402|nr:ABC transporter ATP-binding protein [Streptococcus sp.]EID20887.1 ABC transporter, ATP-binding protein [Streptococcus mitis SK616]MDN3290709.1 ABC transporter ATP-binding protein [Streptococcus sp.]
MIKIENISKIFNKGKFNEFIALKNITCQIETGSWTTVVGASGSGKSTLLKCLSGLERVSAGEIYLDEDKITDFTEKKLLSLRKNKISFIFQDYNLIEDLKMIENIFLDTKVDNDILTLAHDWGVGNVLYRFPNECSGGQRQKIAILRALNQNSSIIFCDEPTGALDTKSSKEVLKVLKQINKERKTTIIMVTHNTLIEKISDYVITVHDGEVLSYEKNNLVAEVDDVQW